MRLPISWLKEFVPVKISTQALADRLSMTGLEVEEVLQVGGEDVLEVNVTPNRGDCLSIMGLAREVAAILDKKYETRRPVLPARSNGRCPLKISVRAKKGVPRYTLQCLEQVRVGPSPDWMVKRLEQMGLRSINNVVDVTNYLLLEWGQPLHAFDLDKIQGALVVREASLGEKLVTLDGLERELGRGDLVIADSSGPIALAGVMGGRQTEVDDRTRQVALESAFFDPVMVRKVARRLGLRTESSYRFERGIDPGLTAWVSARATLLMQEICGARPLGTIIDLSSKKLGGWSVSFRPTAVGRLLGGKWSLPEIRRIFDRLKLKVAGSGKIWRVRVPAYRWDLQEETDLIEEVVRLKGLEALQVTFPPMTKGTQEIPVDFYLQRGVRRLLESCGLSETIHFSFSGPHELRHFEDLFQGKPVRLSNPFGEEDSRLRPTLLPALLKSVAHHHHHKISEVRLFELQKVFVERGNRIEEEARLAVVLSGGSLFRHWSEGREIDFFELKGLVEKVLKFLHIEGVEFLPEKVSCLHPGKSAVVSVEGKRVGVLGEIHPDVSLAYELKKATFLFEMSWSLLMSPIRREARFRPFGLFPAVERDLSLLVDKRVSAAALLKTIREQGHPLVQNVSIFDLYEGKNIPPGKRSLGFSLRLGRDDRTLTDGEVTEMYDKVTQSLKRGFEAEIR